MDITALSVRPATMEIINGSPSVGALSMKTVRRWTFQPDPDTGPDQECPNAGTLRDSRPDPGRRRKRPLKHRWKCFVIRRSKIDRGEYRQSRRLRRLITKAIVVDGVNRFEEAAAAEVASTIMAVWHDQSGRKRADARAISGYIRLIGAIQFSENLVPDDQ